MLNAEALERYSRRGFLAFESARSKSNRPVKIIPPVKGKSDHSSPSREPNNNGFNRREAIPIIIIGTIGTGIAITRLLNPWNWFNNNQENIAPTTTPTPAATPEIPVTPTPELLDPRIIANARREVFKLDNYPMNLRQKMVNFWLQGETKSVQYTKDNQAYLFSFEPAKPNTSLSALAETTVTVLRRSLSTSGSALSFMLSGTYDPLLGDGLPEQTKKRLTDMNFMHEGLVSIACVNGLISVGKDLGLDFGFPSKPQPQESKQISQLNKYIPTIINYAEAVAEINDYVLTSPLLDKNPQNQIKFSNYPRGKYPVPLISGEVFRDNGLTFIVDQALGPSLKGISELDQLAKQYPSLEDIPGSSEYLKYIQNAFNVN